MKIFIPVVGQVINIGDTLHRKILLSWLRDKGTLHIYVGNTPQSFIEALNLPPSAVLYKNIAFWLLTIGRSSLFKKNWFVFIPGEINLGVKRLFGELLLLPFLLFVKANRGKVFRIGIAAKSNTQIPLKKIWNFIFSFSNAIYWRTQVSKTIFVEGELCPDLAFYNIDERINFSEKNKLVISLRGDRPFPSLKWISAIKAFSKENVLQPVCVSQVRIDNEYTLLLAKELSCEAIIWEDFRTHNQQEEIVNNIYRKAKLAVSDRLHVLIAAYTKGCIPTNISTHPGTKVEEHFDVINITHTTLFEKEKSQEEIIAFLNRHLTNGFDTNKMFAAKQWLEKIRNNTFV